MKLEALVRKSKSKHKKRFEVKNTKIEKDQISLSDLFEQCFEDDL